LAHDLHSPNEAIIPVWNVCLPTIATLNADISALLRSGRGWSFYDWWNSLNLRVREVAVYGYLPAMSTNKKGERSRDHVCCPCFDVYSPSIPD